MSKTIKVMSFNMRTAVKADTPNSFWERKPRILEMLRREKPDIVGFQEVTDEMRRWLSEELREYTVVGCGREKNYHGESVATAYRTDTVQMIAMDHFWLSSTPKQPGSRYTADQSTCPRITAALRLVVDDAEPFWVYNTHLDHKGAGARYLGMLQTLQKISESEEKFILMGDMNATQETPEIRLVEETLGTRGVVECTADVGKTFHGFRHELRNHIDYIFSDCSYENACVVPDEGKDDLYYSDHLAVCTDITLP